MRGKFSLWVRFAMLSLAIVPAAAASIINLNATSAETASETLTLEAGTYTVSIVGTSVAGGLYDGWNSSDDASSNDLWTDRYGIQFNSGDQLGFVIAGNTGYATAAAALAAYSAATSLQVYDYTTSSPGDFYSNPFSFTLPDTTQLTLSIPDWGSYGDDSGGESLLISQVDISQGGEVSSAPEPGTTGLLAGGLTMAEVFKRRMGRRRLRRTKPSFTRRRGEEATFRSVRRANRPAFSRSG